MVCSIPGVSSLLPPSTPPLHPWIPRVPPPPFFLPERRRQSIHDFRNFRPDGETREVLKLFLSYWKSKVAFFQVFSQVSLSNGRTRSIDEIVIYEEMIIIKRHSIDPRDYTIIKYKLERGRWWFFGKAVFMADNEFCRLINSSYQRIWINVSPRRVNIARTTSARQR